ncbi:MAG TPA: rhomboid family intramembrane serine protease [Terracidiphilus sp.]|jgi:membrane associated rhomboid family serine protease
MAEPPIQSATAIVAQNNAGDLLQRDAQVSERTPINKQAPYVIVGLVPFFLITLNTAIFMWIRIICHAKSIPSVHDDFYGASWGPLTLSGEWWRLLTSLFVHRGIDLAPRKRTP